MIADPGWTYIGTGSHVNAVRVGPHRHARPLRDRAIVHLILGTGLRRAEVTGLDLTQLDPGEPDELRRMKKARLNDVRGKGRTSRTVFLARDARHAIADYLEAERPGDTDDHSDALFLAASSISARPGGRLSPRSINTIVGQICATPSGTGSRKHRVTTAPNSSAASATLMTATCACTPTRPTTSPPAGSKTSDQQKPGTICCAGRLTDASSRPRADATKLHLPAQPG